MFLAVAFCCWNLEESTGVTSFSLSLYSLNLAMTFSIFSFDSSFNMCNRPIFFFKRASAYRCFFSVATRCLVSANRTALMRCGVAAE